MKILSIFNNKGGVGKTTLTFHLAHALAELGKRVFIMDLDGVVAQRGEGFTS